jgi:hypothetical protein
VAFAIDLANYGSADFSLIDDPRAQFINERIPVSTRSADRTAGASTTKEAAASIPCVAAYTVAGRQAGYPSAQRSNMGIVGRSEDTRRATESAKANRQGTKTGSLPGATAPTRKMSKNAARLTNARSVLKSPATSTKTPTAKHDKSSTRHARDVANRPIEIIGVAVPAKVRLSKLAEMERATDQYERKTASLPGSTTHAKRVNQTTASTNAIETAKSGTASSTKTKTLNEGEAEVEHASEVAIRPVASVGIAVPVRAKPLTAPEMERVTAGGASVVAENQVEAQALAPRAGLAQTTTSARTLAVSNSSPVPGLPFADLSSNYSNSKATASAIGTQLAEAGGSSYISVIAKGGGAQIDTAGAASAIGGDRSQAQLSLQFYGLSIGHVDLAFGTAAATACCVLAAQVTAHGVAGGGYSQTIRASPVSTIPGQVQSRVDIAVVSSSLPLLDAGQVMSFGPRGFPSP